MLSETGKTMKKVRPASTIKKKLQKIQTQGIGDQCHKNYNQKTYNKTTNAKHCP